MADNTYDVGSVGRDYATIASWESDTGYNLVTATTREIGDLYDDSDFSLASAITFAGATTNSSYYRLMRAASGEEYDPVTDTGVWITGSLGDMLRFQESYFQVHYTGAENSGSGVVYSNEAANNKFIACFGLQELTTDAGVEVFNSAGLSTHVNTRYYSCIAVGSSGSSGEGAQTGINVWVNGSYAMNCVAWGCNRGSGVGRGISQNPYGDRIQNCISFGSGEVDFNFAETHSYNCSGDTSANGTGSISGQTATDIFNDPANWDFRLKTGSNAIDAGTDLSTYFIESFVAGIEHGADSGSWNMGAYDGYVAVAGKTGTGAPSLPVPAIDGTGKFVRSGSGAPSLPVPTIDGTGTRTGNWTGTGAIVLPVPTMDGSGSFIRTGAGGITLPAPTADGSGLKGAAKSGSGSIALLLPLVEGAGTKHGNRSGTGDITLPIPVADGSGARTGERTGTGAIDLLLPLIAGSGTQGVSKEGTGAVTLPLVILGGIGDILHPHLERKFLVDLQMDGNSILDCAAFYFGPPGTDGTWRLLPSGGNLLLQLREAGSYVTKDTWTP